MLQNVGRHTKRWKFRRECVDLLLVNSENSNYVIDERVVKKKWTIGLPGVSLFLIFIYVELEYYLKFHPLRNDQIFE